MNYYKWIYKADNKYTLGKLYTLSFFDDSAEYSSNAHYVYTAANIHEWSFTGTHLYEVHLPANTRIIELTHVRQLKVNQFKIIRELSWGRVLELNSNIIEHVPRHLIDDRRYINAFYTGVCQLRDMPKYLINQQICLFAVNRCGYLNLGYVPLKLLTLELCNIAISQDGRSIRYVPECMLTDDMCIAAINQNILAIKYVPPARLTPDMCMIALKKNSHIILHIPEKCITEDMCLAAVRQNGLSLREIPTKMITQEMINIAISNNELASRYAP